MIHVAQRLFPTLFVMKIDVVEWGSRRLLTSDHPIVYYKRNPHPLMGYGLENCDQVWFPVDPKHLIVLSLDDPKGRDHRGLPRSRSTALADLR
jgi:hypothetical protein